MGISHMGLRSSQTQTQLSLNLALARAEDFQGRELRAVHGNLLTLAGSHLRCPADDGHWDVWWMEFGDFHSLSNARGLKGLWKS